MQQLYPSFIMPSIRLQELKDSMQAVQSNNYTHPYSKRPKLLHQLSPHSGLSIVPPSIDTSDLINNYQYHSLK